MAKPNDALAQRQRKQKIFLAIGGVVLAALLVIQGPKLFKQLNGSGSTAPAPAASTEGSTSSTTAGSSTTSTSTETSTPTPVAAKGAAILVGVPVNPSVAPEPDEGQLWSFSRFEAKDPFEQNVTQETAGVTSGGGSSSNSNSGSGNGGSGSGGGAAAPKPQVTQAQPAAPTAVGGIALGGTSGVGAPAEAPATHATIAVNGKPEPLEVKDVFPKAEKAFVLVGLKGKTAKIGVAGGSFTSGGTVSLELGKQVTLVDTATGARYVLRLLYVGSGPEQIQKFSSGEKK